MVAVLLVFQVDLIATPGPKRSTQVPRLETRPLSLLSDAATVMAAGVLAGDTVQASRLLLPAAIV